MRRDGILWLIAPLLCIWPMAANAEDGDAARLIAECSAADLAQASLDSCLERVRVLEETNPSPQLQTLEASLEQRESRHPVGTPASAPPAPRVVEVAPGPNVTADVESERDQSLQPAQPDSSTPRSGVALEDEPPVSDAPDAPAGESHMDDGTNDPPS